jgi:flagellar biogenesis protein FliO
VSVVEDVISLTVALLSILVPILGVLLLILLVVWFLRRRWRKRSPAV